MCLSPPHRHRPPPQEWAVRRSARRYLQWQARYWRFCSANKPRGLQAARKLRTDRRLNRWVSPPRSWRASDLTMFHYRIVLCRRTNHTRSVLLATSTKPPPQEVPHTQRVSFLRRSVSRLSSPTPPFASAFAYNSSRTARRSRLSSPCVTLLSYSFFLESCADYFINVFLSVYNILIIIF